MKRFLIFAFSASMFYLMLALIKENDKFAYSRCGTILAMKDGFDVVVHHRHKGSDYADLENRLIIVANFSGNIESHDVGENTYFRKKVGDEICFRANDGVLDDWAMVPFFIGIFGLCYLVFTSKTMNN